MELRVNKAKTLSSNSSGSWLWRLPALLLMAAVMLGPLLWMARVALSPAGSDLNLVLFSGEWTLDIFSRLFANGDIVRALLNSLGVGIIVTAGNVAFCFSAGYALARRRAPGGRILFTAALLTLMVPAHILIVPLYLMLTKAGIHDTYWALILPFLVSPIGIFMVKQYLDSIPTSLEEAARMDGASELRTLFAVVAPVCRPILATLAIQTFLVNWNSFLFPFILTSSKSLQTLPVALAMMQGHQAIDWQSLMAGSALAVVPVLLIFLIFQRHIISGITAGAIKQ